MGGVLGRGRCRVLNYSRLARIGKKKNTILLTQPWNQSNMYSQSRDCAGTLNGTTSSWRESKKKNTTLASSFKSPKKKNLISINLEMRIRIGVGVCSRNARINLVKGHIKAFCDSRRLIIRFSWERRGEWEKKWKIWKLKVKMRCELKKAKLRTILEKKKKIGFTCRFSRACTVAFASCSLLYDSRNRLRRRLYVQKIKNARRKKLFDEREREEVWYESVWRFSSVSTSVRCVHAHSQDKKEMKNKIQTLSHSCTKIEWKRTKKEKNGSNKEKMIKRRRRRRGKQIRLNIITKQYIWVWNKLYEIIHIYLWREGILRGEKMYLIFISLHLRWFIKKKNKYII